VVGLTEVGGARERRWAGTVDCVARYRVLCIVRRRAGVRVKGRLVGRRWGPGDHKVFGEITSPDRAHNGVQGLLHLANRESKHFLLSKDPNQLTF
jgi:hypothetical protein